MGDTYITYETSGYVSSGSTSSGSPVVAIVALALFVLVVVAIFKVFKRGGKPGWHSLIPVLNFMDLLEIGGNPKWFVVLILFVPFANIYALIKMYDGLSKRFGHGTGFTLGLIFLGPIFFMILAFEKDKTASVATETVAAEPFVTAPVEPTAPVAPETTFGTTTNEGIVGEPVAPVAPVESIPAETPVAPVTEVTPVESTPVEPVVETPVQPANVQPVSSMFEAAPVETAAQPNVGDPNAAGAIAQPSVNPFAPAAEQNAIPTQNTDNTQM